MLIVGDGPHRKTLENLASELNVQNNVKFLGYVSNEKKYSFLASSQALLFPSLCEGFGLVILEAFSQQKPVLVSDVKPLSDLISNKTNGFVLSQQNENEWATAILEIIQKPSSGI